MWNTFKYTILELVRMPGVLVWALAFPLILSTVFMMMFGPLDDQSEIDPIPLVAVDPADDVEGQSFQAFLDALSDDGNGESLFAITYVPNAEEAVDLVERNMAEENPYVGYVQLLEGTPDVHVTSVSDLTGMEWLKTSILVMAMDNYVANAAMIRDLMNDNPGLVAQPDMAETLASMTEPIEATVRTTVTANQPKESVRFYFALLGMAALFGGTLGMIAFQRAQGARRDQSRAHRGRNRGRELDHHLCLPVRHVSLHAIRRWNRLWGARWRLPDHDGDCGAHGHGVGVRYLRHPQGSRKRQEWHPHRHRLLRIALRRSLRRTHDGARRHGLGQLPRTRLHQPRRPDISCVL